MSASASTARTAAASSAAPTALMNEPSPPSAISQRTSPSTSMADSAARISSACVSEIPTTPSDSISAVHSSTPSSNPAVSPSSLVGSVGRTRYSYAASSRYRASSSVLAPARKRRKTWKLDSPGPCTTSRAFSSRKCDRRAPDTAPRRLNTSSTSLPKRDELLFITVRAFPNDSRMGLSPRILASTGCAASETVERALPADTLEARRFSEPLASALATSSTCRINNLVDSVFPEPLSPLMTQICESKLRESAV
mmetsp:Transcript_2613/g.7833  ORF Transcript_2613/g.7833 Transcript_2613/m.7833 type:complete len:253 (-) Transcript_2613:326-1084(-)